MVIENITVFKRARLPFIIRLFPAVFHPGFLLLLVLSGGLAYFAGNESGGMVIGLYGVATLVLALGVFVIYQLIWNKIQIVTQIEVVQRGLRVEFMRYDTVLESIIPAVRLDLDLRRFRSRRGSVRYSLSISDSGQAQTTFTLRASFEILAKILHDIDQTGIVTLRAKENEAIKNWQSGKAWEKSTMGIIMKYATPAVVVVILGYQLRNIKDLAKFWPSQVSQADSTKLKDPGSMASGYAMAGKSLNDKLLPNPQSLGIEKEFSTAALDLVIKADDNQLAFAFHTDHDRRQVLYLASWQKSQAKPDLLEAAVVNYPETCEVALYDSLYRVSEHKTVSGVSSGKVVNAYYSLKTNGFFKLREPIIETRLNVTSLPFTLLGDSVSFSYHTDQTGTHLICELFYGDSFYCTLPTHAGASLALSEMTAVQAADINHDGTLDLIVRGEFLSGVGPDGAKPGEWVSLYFQTPAGQFLRSDEIDSAVNRLSPEQRTIDKFESMDADYSFIRD